MAAACRAVADCAALELVSVKDRRAARTHDAVLVLRFEGVLVEVQFHFRAVVALKAFAHIAYTIARLGLGDDGTSLYQLATLYNNSWLIGFDLAREGVGPEVIRCLLSL